MEHTISLIIGGKKGISFHVLSGAHILVSMDIIHVKDIVLLNDGRVTQHLDRQSDRLFTFLCPVPRLAWVAVSLAWVATSAFVVAVYTRAIAFSRFSM